MRLYRLARAAGYSPLQAFVAVTCFPTTTRAFLEPTEAEANAVRNSLREAGYHVDDSPLLPDLVNEWHNLPPDADPNVRSACLARIRHIHPQLAHRLSQERIASLMKTDPDLPHLLAEWHAVPLFSDDFNNDGYDKVEDACLDKIRKIDPELGSQLWIKRHAERQEAAHDPGG